VKIMADIRPSSTTAVPDRPRPAIADVVRWWSPDGDAGTPVA